MPPEQRNGTRPEVAQTVSPEDREMWLGVRRGLIQMLAAIEKRYGFEPREREH